MIIPLSQRLYYTPTVRVRISTFEAYFNISLKKLPDAFPLYSLVDVFAAHSSPNNVYDETLTRDIRFVLNAVLISIAVIIYPCRDTQRVAFPSSIHLSTSFIHHTVASWFYFRFCRIHYTRKRTSETYNVGLLRLRNVSLDRCTVTGDL